MLSPQELSRALGQKFPPTPQQADVISSPLAPTLVVAGAGAGKTETMAARVVWLVASGLVDPDRVLGLTFTRKAAQQLSKRIRDRLEQLSGIDNLRDLDPTGALATKLEAIAPTVSTYDSYAGRLISEYGLLLLVEPSSRLISQTELFQIAHSIVSAHTGALNTSNSPNTVTSTLMSLVSEMDNHMVSPTDIEEESAAFLAMIEDVEATSKRAPSKEVYKWRDTQVLRNELLPLVQQLKTHLADNHLMTFGEQMSLAARLAAENPQVGASQRNRYQIIMLDEYQDTGHAQRVLLKSLFAGTAVTAVGDPMQSIYGWRGATAANLERFLTDFGNNGAPATKKELTVSFRNPPEVLDLANRVSRELLGVPEDPRRPVQPLEPGPAALNGTVRLGFFPSMDEERSYVADHLAQAYEQHDGDHPFTAAVLVRKRKHSAAIALELQQRGVPVEIVGLAGLLGIPEVADLVAIATLLVRPYDTQAAMRILAGPSVGLGMADLMALSDRAYNLSGRDRRATTELSRDPLERLKQIIADTIPSDQDSIVGLAEAVADLDERLDSSDGPRYSAKGSERLRTLAARLRYLRTNSLSNSLPDLFADIERVFGIRTEVLQREDPRSDGATGTAHLDRFAEVVQDFSRIPGANLSLLLDYLSLAESEENGLEPGEVQVTADRVQILTVHKAKGLEWQHVAVLHADANTYVAKASTWLTNASAVPSALRGDAKGDEDLVGAPVFEIDTPETAAELAKAGKAHIADFKQVAAEENARLFYVAITRAEQQVLVTASADPSKKRPVLPYEYLTMLRNDFPDSVEEWHERGEAEDYVPPAPQEAVFPPNYTVVGAEDVFAAMQKQPDLISDDDLFERWEKEVSALIEEHEQLSAPVVAVDIGVELTATDIVNLAKNPENFAQRRRRPVPFKPNSYAKRGTAFHEWLENRFGAEALLDETELPGIGEELDDSDLDRLKEAFLDSEWADRTPEHVEHPFEVSIGHHIVRGRMDAVFKNPDGRWIVVDWKTGQPPTDNHEKESVAMQLAVYRLAWARLQGIDVDRVDAAFHYVGRNVTYRPQQLPDGEELALKLDPSV